MDGVCSQLERDLLAADFLAAMFWSAMSGFRHDTILRPFPPTFLGEQEHKNIEELVCLCVCGSARVCVRVCWYVCVSGT